MKSQIKIYKRHKSKTDNQDMKKNAIPRLNIPITNYRVCDGHRDIWKTIGTTSLKELVAEGKKKLFLDGALTVVLETNGTKVDDEEYFATLNPNTSLMILCEGEKWTQEQKSVDETDDRSFGRNSKCYNCGVNPKTHKGQIELHELSSDQRYMVELIDCLQSNIADMALYGEEDLDKLADMDIDDFTKLNRDGYNRRNLEFIKDAAERLLLDRQQTQQAIELLQLYSELRTKTETPSKRPATHRKNVKRRRTPNQIEKKLPNKKSIQRRVTAEEDNNRTVMRTRSQSRKIKEAQ